MTKITKNVKILLSYHINPPCPLTPRHNHIYKEIYFIYEKYIYHLSISNLKSWQSIWLPLFWKNLNFTPPFFPFQSQTVKDTFLSQICAYMYASFRIEEARTHAYQDNYFSESPRSTNISGQYAQDHHIVKQLCMWIERNAENFGVSCRENSINPTDLVSW